MEEQEIQSSSRSGLPRSDEMKTPDDVSAMVCLKGLGWGAKRIAAELGCSKKIRRLATLCGAVALEEAGLSVGLVG